MLGAGPVVEAPRLVPVVVEAVGAAETVAAGGCAVEVVAGLVPKPEKRDAPGAGVLVVAVLAVVVPELAVVVG